MQLIKNKTTKYKFNSLNCLLKLTPILNLMNKYLVTSFFLFSFLFINAQINYDESTFQAVAYWNKNEITNYKVITSKYAVKEQDSILKNKITYDIELKVVDSSAKHYDVQCSFKNFVSTSSNPIENKLDCLLDGISFIYKTNELGTIDKAKNFDKALKEIKNRINKIEKDFPIAVISNDFKRIKLMTENSDLALGNFTKDLTIFHYFHGAAFEMNVPNSIEMQVPNLLEGKFFDANVDFELVEINSEFEFAVLRMDQTVDNLQLRKALENFSKKAKVNLKPETLDNLKNEVRLSSSIHNSGWPIYIAQVVDVFLGEDQTVEIKEFEIVIEDETEQ